MDEIVMKEYLRNRGMSDHDFMIRLKEVLGSDRYDNKVGHYDNGMYERYNNTYNINRHSDSQLMDMIEGLSYEDKKRLISMIESDGVNRNMYRSMSRNNSYMDESQAKHIVSQMYHSSNGRKYVGEKYDLHKAKEVKDRYNGAIPSHYSVEDIYIAINAQYHDYCELFKNWFGDNIDNKIIESAIVFWFKDVDYKHGNKVHKYFES